jgi:hypothetical protein
MRIGFGEFGQDRLEIKTGLELKFAGMGKGTQLDNLDLLVLP